ncbi:MAG TPA: hydroxyacid dehydrogenase, partial [Sulfurovum sp.]|nr:hydroxyacid dehydrogenase [Sulfurovum sp.]
MTIVLLDAKTLGDDLNLFPLEQFGTVTRYDTTTEEKTLE